MTRSRLLLVVVLAVILLFVALATLLALLTFLVVGSGSRWSQTANVREPDVTTTPDGEKIAFIRDTGPSNLYVLDLTSGTAVKIVNDGDSGHPSSPGWSSNGKRIVYVRQVARRLGPPSDAHGLYTANADGTEEKQILASEDVSYPSWSPSGEKIVYARECELYVANTDGTGEERVASKGEKSGDFRCFWKSDWSPDGKRLAVQASIRGRPGGNHLRGRRWRHRAYELDQRSQE